MTDHLRLERLGNRLDRRTFFGGGLAIGGAAFLPQRVSAEEPPITPSWSMEPGRPAQGYGVPSEHEAHVLRHVGQPYGELGSTVTYSTTPLEALGGTVTPNGLHFEVHHSGVPAIDPSAHELVIHGRVARPLRYSVEALLRYPMESHHYFLECSGNGMMNALMPDPVPATCGMLNGLISGSEWTGVPLRYILDEAGVEDGSAWVVATGADGSSLNRSIPLSKLRSDSLIALYQNGERLRPEQGYPLRLFIPGWEGNMSVKWLRSLEVSRHPAHTKDEVGDYAEILPDGKILQFTFAMGVKSVITHPSPGHQLERGRPYEITGLAWTGTGIVKAVDVSADGGATWRRANLQGPSLPRSLTRFSLPWRWDGRPATLQSRATDQIGNVQPTRADWKKKYSPITYTHYNAIQSWRVSRDGNLENIYA